MQNSFYSPPPHLILRTQCLLSVSLSRNIKYCRFFHLYVATREARTTGRGPLWLQPWASPMTCIHLPLELCNYISQGLIWHQATSWSMLMKPQYFWLRYNRLEFRNDKRLVIGINELIIGILIRWYRIMTLDHS